MLTSRLGLNIFHRIQPSQMGLLEGVLGFLITHHLILVGPPRKRRKMRKKMIRKMVGKRINA